MKPFLIGYLIFAYVCGVGQFLYALEKAEKEPDEDVTDNAIRSAIGFLMFSPISVLLYILFCFAIFIKDFVKTVKLNFSGSEVLATAVCEILAAVVILTAAAVFAAALRGQL